MSGGRRIAGLADRLATMNGVSLALLQAPALRQCYDVLREGATQFATIDAFAIGVYHPDRTRLRLRYLFEIDVEYPRVTRSPIPRLYQRLLDTPEPISLPTRQAIIDASGSDLWRIGDPSPLAQTAFFAPLFIEDRLLGFLSVQSYVPNAFSDDAQASLIWLAHQAAMVERSFLWRSRSQAAQTAHPGPAVAAPVSRQTAFGIDVPDLIAQATSVGDPAFSVFEALIDAVDDKDSYTRSHAALVSQTALAAAESLRLPDQMRRALYTAATLLDVGKISIPEEVLLKPGKLTAEEMALVRQHTVVGAAIAGQMASLKAEPELLEAVRGAVRSHHEHWDGTGYPDGLRGVEIPYLARLLAIADSYAAMLVDRPYQQAMTADQAQAELRAGSGVRYDPTIVDAFIRGQERGQTGWLRLGSGGVAS